MKRNCRQEKGSVYKQRAFQFFQGGSGDNGTVAKVGWGGGGTWWSLKFFFLLIGKWNDS